MLESDVIGRPLVFMKTKVLTRTAVTRPLHSLLRYSTGITLQDLQLFDCCQNRIKLRPTWEDAGYQ